MPKYGLMIICDKTSITAGSLRLCQTQTNINSVWSWAWKHADRLNVRQNNACFFLEEHYTTAMMRGAGRRSFTESEKNDP